jgi:hypothetical protein
MADSSPPQGVERVIREVRKSASFKTELLKDRAEAAMRAGIELTSAEVDMLNTTPAE